MRLARAELIMKKQGYRFLAAYLTAVLSPMVASAQNLSEEDVVSYMEKSVEISIGRDLTGEESERLAKQTLGALASDPGVTSEKLPVIAETAMAFRSTTNAATRGIFYDTLRQLFSEVYVTYQKPVALSLFVLNDHLVDQHGLGIGLAMSDIYASAWLRALYEGRFEHPRDVKLTNADLQAMLIELKSEYPTLTPPNQQVLTRMNAWAAGVETNWEEMGANEQRSATGMSTETDIPSANVVLKVTGTSDIIEWVAGMDFGISMELADKYPTMVEFHRIGGTGAAVLPLMARLGKLDNSAADWSNFQSLQMLQNLNNFYSNNGTMSGVDSGGAMFGWQW